MEEFVRAHEKDVIGLLNGFDRLVLRGTLRSYEPTTPFRPTKEAVSTLGRRRIGLLFRVVCHDLRRRLRPVISRLWPRVQHWARFVCALSSMVTFSADKGEFPIIDQGQYFLKFF